MNRRRYMGGSKIYDAEVEWIGGRLFLFLIEGVPTQGYISHKTMITNNGNVSNFAVAYQIGNYVSGTNNARYFYQRMMNSRNIQEGRANGDGGIIGTCGYIYTRTKARYDTTFAPSYKNTLQISTNTGADFTYSYYIQIHDMADNLVFDLIPVRLGSEGCLYDKVKGTLYHATSGTPVFGSDVVGG